LGYNDLGSTGSIFYETPNIDRIATGGVSFIQAYANSRVCSPSRASIMTGQFPARHGITDWIGAFTGEAWRQKQRHNILLPADYKHKLPAEQITLAEALRDNGYHTFFAGNGIWAGQNHTLKTMVLISIKEAGKKDRPLVDFFHPG